MACPRGSIEIISSIIIRLDRAVEMVAQEAFTAKATTASRVADADSIATVNC